MSMTRQRSDWLPLQTGNNRHIRSAALTPPDGTIYLASLQAWSLPRGKEIATPLERRRRKSFPDWVCRLRRLLWQSTT